ncbi:MAG: thioesterase family protein [Rhodococcus sp.]|uniref:acyl-CoA thioesterase domain-containing protein n=1 Tax=Rhodococcus TaxID=1827 RepID=UPI00211A3B08|nr:acyl-CoA thioesterase domain-containing protein [Rhodococcus qingshengii]MCW0191418.1 thioesterase family protein [Rhodococcus sp. (in: high G+C Gram-positive bacteria)]
MAVENRRPGHAGTPVSDGGDVMAAFFTCENGRYIPGRKSLSAWSATQLSGTVVCGLLAHGLETCSPGIEFVPARFAVDMFSPVLDEPIELRSAVVGDGNRIRVADAHIVQRNQVRARATAQFLIASAEPPGEIWRPIHDMPVPDARLDHADGSMPLFKSGAGEWTHSFTSGLNSHRKTVWNNIPPLVDGMPITTFERSAVVADFTNLVCNWGTAGVGYINTDVTMTLSRLPEGPELGLHAWDNVSANGIAVGTASLYDRTGPLGTCTITALSNARRQVDVAVAGEAQPATAGMI